MQDLIVRRPEGLYCPSGDFYIDPWRPVDRAVITHAHADHSRAGHRHYLAHPDAEHVMRARLGDVHFQGLGYEQKLKIGNATVSLHPAGHVLGSAQVRVQAHGSVWVASGDYYLTGNDNTNSAQKTCAPFEPVQCDCFITESTFGLPIYRWQSAQHIYDQVNAWWSATAAEQRPALLMGYSFGKAQRLLAGVDASIGPIYVHSAVEKINAACRAAGISLPKTELLTRDTNRKALAGSLIIAPPAVHGSSWTRGIGPHSDAFASGWMRLRGARRRRGVDKGFVLSDHADWPGLLRAVAASGASRVIVTHGYENVMVRYFRELGLQASTFATEFGDEHGDGE